MKPKLLVGIIAAAVLIAGVGLWLRPGAHSPGGMTAPGSPSGPLSATPLGNDGRPYGTNQPARANAHARHRPSRTLRICAGSTPRRAGALALVSTNLTEPDGQTLRGLLLRSDPEDAEQGGQVFKNQLLDALCALNPPPPWLGETLVQMYRDRSQNEVIRDYAVQHLAAYYEQMELTQPDASQTRQPAQAVLWEALSETDSSIAGTALLALNRLSAGRAEFDRTRLGAEALRLAQEGGAGDLSRATAFQVCAQLGIDEALPVLERAARQARSMPLRISAVGALGVLGSAQAKPILSELQTSGETELKLPVTQALKGLERKARQARLSTQGK